MNNIALPAGFITALDEKFRKESITADLIGDDSLFKDGNLPNEIAYPQLSVSGLGDYSREDGTGGGSYSNNSVSLEWKTTKYNYDRGTKIQVDVMDDVESAIGLFANAAATLMTEKVAPEADAFTFAKLAESAGTKVDADLENAEAFLAALIEATNVLDEAEVPEEGRYLYATPTLINGIMGLETSKSREVLNSFSLIKKVPQARFYSAIDLADGKTAGEELGHYKKADEAVDINFMIVVPQAIIKHDKHIASDIISPKFNLDSDALVMKYRKYGIVDVYKNKAKGIYLHTKEVTE